MPVGALPVVKIFSQKSRFCFGPKTVVLKFLSNQQGRLARFVRKFRMWSQSASGSLR